MQQHLGRTRAVIFDPLRHTSRLCPARTKGASVSPRVDLRLDVADGLRELAGHEVDDLHLEDGRRLAKRDGNACAICLLPADGRDGTYRVLAQLLGEVLNERREALVDDLVLLFERQLDSFVAHRRPPRRAFWSCCIFFGSIPTAAGGTMRGMP